MALNATRRTALLAKVRCGYSALLSFACFIQNNFAPTLNSVANYSERSTNLKDVLANKVVAHQKKVIAFRKEYADTVIQSTSIDMVGLSIAVFVLRTFFAFRYTAACAA